MRGDKEQQALVMVYITPDQKVPQDHPIRAIKPVVDRALLKLSPVFNRMYSKRGRPSIPPEHLLKASLLIALYSIRSERQFCERLEYDLLFKWFLDQNIDTPAFDASTFSKNRQRRWTMTLHVCSSQRWWKKREQPAVRRPLHRRRHPA